MKLKKRGEVPPAGNEPVPSVEAANERKKNTKLYIIIPVLILFIGLIIYFAISYQNRDSEVKVVNSLKTSDSLKQKEISLKEKELELREKELSMNKETDVNSILIQKLDSWISSLNNREQNLENYYADNVIYYSWGATSRAKVMEDKRSFYSSWTNFKLRTENPEIIKISDSQYLCSYDKLVNSSNNINGKEYEPKVRSKLVFEKDNSGWLISEETDEKVYFKIKNW